MIELKVTGMTCGHCENAVKKSLQSIAGVEVKVVDREQDRVAVAGDVDIEAVMAAIREEGYEVEVRS